jgi:hypothetical protein
VTAKQGGQLDNGQIMEVRRDVCHGLLNHLGNQKQAVFKRWGVALVGLPVVRLTHSVFPQPQSHILYGRQRVGKWLDARGVNRSHFLDQLKKAIDLRQHSRALGRLEFQSGQIGDTGDISRCQGHNRFSLETGCKTPQKTVWRFKFSQGMGYYPAFADMCAAQHFFAE